MLFMILNVEFKTEPNENDEFSSKLISSDVQETVNIDRKRCSS